MKIKFLLLIVFFAGIWLFFASTIEVETQSFAAMKPDLDFGKFPLYFIANKGQVNERALFYARASRYTLWITEDGLVFDSVGKVEAPKTQRHNENTKEKHGMHHWSFITQHPSFNRDVSRLMFIGAHRNPEILPVEKAKPRVNYFIGSDTSEWYCNVPTSRAVLYKNLYGRIDLKVYGIEKRIEYDWVVKPGGNPEEIRFEYKNVKGTRLDEEGNLLIETDFGELMHKKPVGYQEIPLAQSANRNDVNVTFKKIAGNIYGFAVGEYDRSRELIIDPVVMAYSTYLGGGSTDMGSSIAVDGSGSVYVVGETFSMDFPTVNHYRNDGGGMFSDIFVSRIDTDKSGTAGLIYSTYLGGDHNEFAPGIAVDNSGNAYISGYTASPNYPLKNHYQMDRDGIFYDIFVTKLDTTKSGASGLIYSTYLGGTNYEFCRKGIAADDRGNVYVTGFTSSTDFPTRNPYQTNEANSDAFVTKLDTTKKGPSSLIYSTYLGGGGNDIGRGIAVDDSGCAYVTGFTFSRDFPILNGYQSFAGDFEDVFIAKLDTTKKGRASLLYSTFLGGNGSDYGEAIAVDHKGNVYAVGGTNSTDFPTLNPYGLDPDGSTSDVFVTKLDTTEKGLSSLIYSTYLGGGDIDYGWAIAVDSSGGAYVTGYTFSTDFPIRDPYQAHMGGEIFDAFVTKIDAKKKAGSSLIYSTYLGGRSVDCGCGIAVDNQGNLYVTGHTYSSDFPLMNPYQTYPNGVSADAFVTKLTPPGEITAVNPSSGPMTGGNEVTVEGINLGNGSDITSVTLCGFAADIIGQTETRVKVTAGPGTPGTGRVKVISTSHGTTAALDAYTYIAVNLPAVTTRKVKRITTCSAVSGGNVRDDGGIPVTKRGVCWSTAPNPTTADKKTANGTGTGKFASQITGLTENTAYYVRAYAVNSMGTSYGEEFCFITQAESVTVSLEEPQDGAEVSGFVNIRASTSNQAARVEFYIDNTKAVDFTTAPYEYTWDTTTVQDGSHTVKAVAYNPVNRESRDEITVQVANVPPHIYLNRAGLNYGAEKQGKHTGSQVILIDNRGGGILNWTVSSDAGWLACMPGSGTGTASVEVSIDPAGLVPGTYKGTVTFSDSRADNSPQMVEVYLKVYGSGTENPFGYFDTPVHGSTVMGSIPVTGWVLDDIGIESVVIYREEGNTLVYIGNATFVEGARPDIDQIYVDYPYSYKAGWGCMMLTHSLPDGGNGTYKIHAAAVDLEGKEVTLGIKTIHCDNASAVKPFGTIDTPDEGGTISGSSFVNFGWALTPQPNTIPTDGSTIRVWIDGVPKGNPVYNQYRLDIAALFPGYNNSEGAVGYFYLDTTQYANGVHTIQWTAADNGGNTGGIGSRYFTIRNAGGDRASREQACLFRESIAEIPVEYHKPLHVKRGYNPDTDFVEVYPDGKGDIYIEMEELERLEIQFSNSVLNLCQLPIGSFLDKKRGIFYWQPGPGFLGSYTLVFVEKDRHGNMAKRNIKIMIEP